MYVPSILPNQIQSLRPSKRKIVRTIYTTEKFTHNIQKDLPTEMRSFAQYISDGCKQLRKSLTKQ